MLLSLCTGAAAGTNEGTEQEQRACIPDVFRPCAEFIPDPARITLCLRENVSDLNPDCHAVMSPTVARQQSATNSPARALQQRPD